MTSKGGRGKYSSSQGMKCDQTRKVLPMYRKKREVITRKYDIGIL